MKTLNPTADIVLGRGELLSLDGAEGARIVNRGGVVWITQDGDLRDIVLQRGEAFELDRPTPAIVQAFEPTALTIAAPTRRPERRGLAGWARRLRTATRRIASGPAWA